jgi:hypothetical protein
MTDLTNYPFLLESPADFELAKNHVDQGEGDMGAYAYAHDCSPDRYPCLAQFICWDDTNGHCHCTWSFQTEQDVARQLARFDSHRSLFDMALGLRGEADGSAGMTLGRGEPAQIRAALRKRLAQWGESRSESEELFRRFLSACIKEAEEMAPYLFAEEP